MGTVFNHAGKALLRTHYDTLIIGGGLLGLACAFYLQRLRPQSRMLIAEQDGIPSEMGATYLSPAIFDPTALTGEVTQQVNWVHSVLCNLSDHTDIHRPYDTPYNQTGCLQLEVSADKKAELPLELGERQRQALTHCVQLSSVTGATWYDQAGFGSAESVALHYGYAAVRDGADLMLNTRVKSAVGTRYTLQRLEYNRAMQRVVAREEQVQADTVILAAGAQTRTLAETLWGELLPLKQVYLQYPRLAHDARLPLTEGNVDLPIIQIAGFYLRPQGDGLLIIPPELPADPEGYTPQGGNLMGVRVGVRREVLEQLLSAADMLPILGWPTLNLGKTIENVRGHWEAVTQDGKPVWLDCGERRYALAGGRLGFTLGMASAYDLAALVAGVAERPWV